MRGLPMYETTSVDVADFDSPERPEQQPSAAPSAPPAPASTASAPSVGGADGAAPSPASGAEPTLSADQVKLALRKVKDPELNLNILDLGLVYDIAVTGNDVTIDMSLTSPGCPSGPEIMGDAERQLKTIEGVGAVAVNLVWSPPWTPERIEPRVRAYLGF